MPENSQIVSFIGSLQSINRYVRSRTFDGQDRVVTRVQWLLLRSIARNPGQTVGQLAERIDVRQATMSQMLDRLEKVPYVKRESTKADARVKSVSLTKQGASLIQTLEGQWSESLEEPFSVLTADDQAILVRLMEQLAGAVAAKG